MAVRADGSGGCANGCAPRAPRQHEHAVGRGLPERRRLVVGDRDRSRRRGHGITAGLAEGGDVVPACSRARAAPTRCARRAPGPGAGRALARRTAPAPAAGGSELPSSSVHLAEVVVGEHLGVVEQLLDRLDRRPRRVDPAEQRPSTRRRSASRTSSSSSAAQLCGVLGRGRGGRRSAGRRRGRVGRRARRTAPSSGRTRGTRAGCGGRPSSGRSPTSGFTIDPALRGARRHALEGGQHVGRQRPHRGGQQRHVDDRALAGRRPPQQRGGDAERQRHAAVAVTERAALARSGSRGRAA